MNNDSITLKNKSTSTENSTLANCIILIPADVVHNVLLEICTVLRPSCGYIQASFPGLHHSFCNFIVTVLASPLSANSTSKSKDD